METNRDNTAYVDVTLKVKIPMAYGGEWQLNDVRKDMILRAKRTVLKAFEGKEKEGTFVSINGEPKVKIAFASINE